MPGCQLITYMLQMVEQQMNIKGDSKRLLRGSKKEAIAEQIDGSIPNV